MEFSFERSVKYTAILLAALAVTQAIYTALYISEADVPRVMLWGVEAFLFTFLAAFGGAAMVEAKAFRVGWAAITASAILNVVQVGVGLTMFAPFRALAADMEAFAPIAGSVVAFSFFVYNAAKILLGFAALIFGMAKSADGSKAIGGLTALVGVVAMVSNTSVMILGREGLIPSPVAGASGVIATLLLAWCLLGVRKAD